MQCVYTLGLVSRHQGQGERIFSLLAVTSESGPAAVRPGWRGVVRGRDHCTMTDTIALVLPLAATLVALLLPLAPAIVIIS